MKRAAEKIYGLQIPINIPTMTNHRNVNRLGKIIYRINHAIIADAHPPEIFLPVKFDDADRSRIFGQQFNLR